MRQESTEFDEPHFWAEAMLCPARADTATVRTTDVPVRIHTLGRFTVAIDGRMVCSSGKSRKRPLSLLKALICLGGREVSLCRVGECLWPDSEGDLGARNLAVTLHRLRQLLGVRDAVLQHDGKLTLNDKLCWVDAWQFERWTNEGLALLDDEASRKSAETQLYGAFNLYSGQYLARECDEAWMLAPRLRLRFKFERLAVGLCGHLEEAERYRDAVDLCLQALERDPLNELLYRQLMRCYLRGGEFSRALLTYRNCREALRTCLGVPPAAETEHIYLEALGAATPASPTSDNAAGYQRMAQNPVRRGTTAQ
jgi:LuxR family transcriptional regulator, maltose regulon positive regulatory protein